MKNMFFVLAMLVPTLGVAHEYKIGDLLIEHPYSLETPQSAMAGAGYLTITNTGDTDDALLGVSADFPRVMLHKSVVRDGMASMESQDRITIYSGETVTLAPGSLHIMFMGLNGDPFEEGEEIPAELTFENAGTITVNFNVEARKDEDAGMDHSGH